MRRAILVCGAAVLALGACSKKGTETAAGGQAAPAAEGAAKPAAAGPEAPPTRKAGLWEQTMAFNGMTQTLKMCIDEATEQKAHWWATERRGRSGEVNCPEQKFSRNLTGGWTIHSVCHEGSGMTVTSDGTASGDFGQNYHVEMTSVTTGASMPEANGTHKMVMDGAWKGPCPAGMKPGDMELPGGMHMNALNPEAGPTGAGAGPNHAPSQADIAKMRAQAMEMAKKMKAQGAE